MMPLLGFYSALIGDHRRRHCCAGSRPIGIPPMHLPPAHPRSRAAHTILWVGLIKAPVFGADHRDRRLLPGHAGRRQCRGGRPAHHRRGGAGDLHGHRARRLLRRLLQPRSAGMMTRRRSPVATARDDFVHPIVAGLNNSFGEQVDPRGPRSRGAPRRDPRRGRRLGHRQVGADALDHRAADARRGRDRGVRRETRSTCRRGRGDDIRRRWGVLFQGGALFSTLTVAENVEVPLQANSSASSIRSCADEIAATRCVMSRPARGSGAQISVRAVGRHEQTRRPGPRAGARSRTAVPRRADRRARSDRCGGVRPADSANCSETLGLTVFLDHPRSRHALRDLRPRGGAGRPSKVIAVDTIPNLLALDHPWIQEYLQRAARAARPRPARTARPPKTRAKSKAMDSKGKSGE